MVLHVGVDLRVEFVNKITLRPKSGARNSFYIYSVF